MNRENVSWQLVIESFNQGVTANPGRTGAFSARLAFAPVVTGIFLTEVGGFFRVQRPQYGK